jgi:hypothetical protein
MGCNPTVDDGNLKFLTIRRKLGRAANYLSVGQIYLCNNQLLKAESGIGQHALDLVSRDRLQDDPGVMRQFPQRGTWVPPIFVRAMIPRPAHNQGKLGQSIEPIDLHR